MKTMGIAALGILLLALSACAGRRGDGGEPQIEPPAAAAANQDVFQTGVASWYGDDFQGKLTANGEIYDMRKLTAAHQDLPFHTLVEVENMENGRKVLVRVNDRGPFLKGRIIDLSLKAAQRLEIAEKGTAEVSLRVVRWGVQGNVPGPAGEPEPVAGAPAPGDAPTPSVPAASCYVQAGAFAQRENAEDMLQTLADIFPGLAFRIVEENGLFKVISPDLASLNSCDEVIRELAARHLQGFVREAGSGEEK
jgi:rare lipoprotein A